MKTTESTGQVHTGHSGRALSAAVTGKVLTACGLNSSEKSSGVERYHYHAAIFSPSGFEAGSHPSRPFIERTMSHVHSAYIGAQASQSTHRADIHKHCGTSCRTNPADNELSEQQGLQTSQVCTADQDRMKPVHQNGSSIIKFVDCQTL